MQALDLALQERVLAAGAGWVMDGWPDVDAMLDQLVRLTAPDNRDELSRRTELAKRALLQKGGVADDPVREFYDDADSAAIAKPEPGGSRSRIYEAACHALQRSARSRTPAGWRLRLIQDETDPAHRIWNRLMAREHPLGDRSLVGAQLRYLLECEAGVVGAFGFGPPAFHLECRDQWIGWSLAARRQNLGQVWLVAFSAPAGAARAQPGLPKLQSGLGAGG